MKRISVTTLTVLLASCAYPPIDRVDPNIVAEMDSAARQAASNQREAVREALLPPLRAQMPKVPGTPVEPRFDLVVNAAPAQQVFMSIVAGTRYSMVVNPEVSGRLSLNLKDVTVHEALEAIREVYGYEFRTDGTRIYVEAAGLQTRVFHVNYLSGLRTGRSDLRVSSGTVSANVPGQPGGGGAAPVAAGAAQPGQSVNAIGLGQLNQTTNDATRVSTFSQSDLWQELSNALRTLVGTGVGRSIVVSPQSGVVVVRAMPQEIRSVENYLKAMRVSVERQVMLEAKIIDVTLNNAYQSGVNWAGFSGTRFSGGVQGAGTTLGTAGGLASPSPMGLIADPAARTVVSTTASAAASAASTAAGAAGLGVFGLALQTRNFAALLQFLESQGTTQVLSSPRVATLNNQKAVLKVGTDEFFISNIKSTPVVNTLGVPVGATLEPTLSSFFSGVSLDITPQIDEDGNINLHIHPLVSRVENGSLTFDFGTGIGTTSIPTAKSTINETDTMVRVQDGNIVALGGLMQLELENSRSGVPGVQDVPAVGELFGNRARNVVKKELVILIKPTIIKSGADWEQDITATGDRLRGMRGGATTPAPGSR
ncbi:MAG: secretin N-terminal domain-containing protein [Burkholderiales bacterium]